MTYSMQKEFMELYTPCHKRLSAYTEALTGGNLEEAKDIMGETVLIAFERFGTLEKKESLLYFLFSIASNLYKQSLRRGKFRGIFNTKKAEKIVHDAPRPDHLADVAILYCALDKMALKYRSPLVLFELSGFSIREIAEIEGISESGVKSRLLRARSQLADLLGVKKESAISEKTLTALFS